MPLSAIARRYDHFLIDLDGCLWFGDEPTERAPEALAALREAAKGIVFMTNDARHSPEEFVRKLWRLGFQASLAEVITAGAAVQFSLAGRLDGGAAFVVGSRALVEHVAEAGLRIVNRTEFATRADVVVVADHERFDYAELRTATQAVLRGAALIGVTPPIEVAAPLAPTAWRSASSTRSRPRSGPPPTPEPPYGSLRRQPEYPDPVGPARNQHHALRSRIARGGAARRAGPRHQCNRCGVMRGSQIA